MTIYVCARMKKVNAPGAPGGVGARVPETSTLMTRMIVLLMLNLNIMNAHVSNTLINDSIAKS